MKDLANVFNSNLVLSQLGLSQACSAKNWSWGMGRGIFTIVFTNQSVCRPK